MKQILLVFVVLIFVAPSMEAQSLPKTAGEFANSCKDLEPERAVNGPSAPVLNGFCLGFMNGLLVSNRLFLVMKRGAPLFCAPEAVTPGQAAQIFVKYMSDHPEKFHESAPMMVMVSLMAAFPCSKPD